MASAYKILFWTITTPIVLLANLVRLPLEYIILNVEMIKNINTTYFIGGTIAKVMLDTKKQQLIERFKKK